MDLNVDVPADLDQFWGDDSHGTVVSGKGLVDLGHLAANGRALFNQVDIIARVGGIQRSLYTGNASSNNHDGSKDLFSHKPPLDKNLFFYKKRRRKISDKNLFFILVLNPHPMGGVI
jgi:hypothetical protein